MVFAIILALDQGDEDRFRRYADEVRADQSLHEAPPTRSGTEAFAAYADLLDGRTEDGEGVRRAFDDADYHKDPITALGMTDAFRDAELLAHAIDAGLSGRRPLDAALAEYERRRNAATAQTYETTIQFAHLEPPPAEMQPLFAALAENETQTGRFFGTVTGTVSAAEFFAPENIARITGAPVPA